MKKAAGYRKRSLQGVVYSVLYLFLVMIALAGQIPFAVGQTPSAVITSQKANRGPADNFTGVVWVKMLVPPGTQTDCVVSEVTFEPKGRTFWHTHPNGQVLVVTQGTGYYQEQGKPIQTIRPGESVNIAPNVVHWHGARPTEPLTHFAINPSVSKGGAVNWLRAVTDAEYNPK